MTKILVVDDEKSLVELLKLVLDDLGYEVLTANNDQEALHLMEKNQPTLVISDVMMSIISYF